MDPIKISVCIPTYNQATYLVQAVQSAHNQTRRPFEIIVSNDCSTDDTGVVLEMLSWEIPELKVCNQPVNLGIAKNTDHCLRLAAGDLVVRLDSDDYLSPLYCEKLSELLISTPEAGYAHAAVQEIDQHDRLLRQRWLARASGFQSGSEALQAAVRGYRVAANIIMFRRSSLAAVDYLTGRPDYVEDFHLSASLAAAGFGNVYLSQQLSFYRVWLDEGRTRQKRKMMEISGVRKVFDQVLEPAFERRHWSASRLKRSRDRMACGQADCLSWKVYSPSEKEELRQAIFSLSVSQRVRFFAWMYFNGFGKMLEMITRSRSSAKLALKKILFRPGTFQIIRP